MMKYHTWTIGLVLIAAGVIGLTLMFPAAAQDTQRPPTGTAAAQAIGERRMAMRAKLGMVHQIVEGLATEDFALLKKGAVQLATIAETAAWKSVGDPFYSHYSANFEYAVKGLIKAAESESVEKATFAYVHVTMSCTACHQHVRGTKRVAR